MTGTLTVRVTSRGRGDRVDSADAGRMAVSEFGQIDAAPDPRDLPGAFRHRVDIDVRFADTDAMGHVNNAVYLTYCEAARIGYWEVVTGEPLAGRHHDAESLILAEARITYRAQVFATDRIVVETRAGRIGTSSFTLEHRLTAHDAEGAARLVAVSQIRSSCATTTTPAGRSRSTTPSSPRSSRSRAAPCAGSHDVLDRRAGPGDRRSGHRGRVEVPRGRVRRAVGAGRRRRSRDAGVRECPLRAGRPKGDGRWLSAEETLVELDRCRPGSRRAPGRDRRCHGSCGDVQGTGCFHWAGGRTATALLPRATS